MADIIGVYEMKLPWNRQARPNCDESNCLTGGGMWVSTDFQNQRYVFANPSPNGRGCREAAGEGYK